MIVTQEIDEDHHGNGGVTHSVDENLEVSHDSDALSIEEDVTKPSVLEVGVDVGVTSSSPVDSCLYADS